MTCVKLQTRASQIVVVLLLTSLAALHGMALPQVVTHALHHAHHTAATHSSPLCFWVCTAGQMESAPLVFLQITAHALGYLTVPSFTVVLLSLPQLSTIRGPPLISS
ncbi:MAG: hypothetical protein D6704_09745 [Nitrospirae bacterium]|nr:MAG: hypothetical protein D6704_09745 [Nitrospirota bacterium]